LILPFIILLFIVALILQVGMLFTAAWVLAGLYAVCRLWSWRAVHHLQIERQFADHAFAGDEVEVTLTIHNPGWLPIPYVEVGETWPWPLDSGLFPPRMLSLAPRTSQKVAYARRCPQRGHYSLAAPDAQVGDLLGTGQRTLPAGASQQLTVYPRLVPLERLGLPTRSPYAVLPANMALFEDTSRITGVRGYRPSDSLRHIHWTATARTGELQVKRYQPAVARETLICLSLDLADYPVTSHNAVEQAIVVAASLANHIATQEGLPVGLAMEAGENLFDNSRRLTLSPRSGSPHLMQLLEALARAQPAGRCFLALLREESIKLAWGSTLVVVTGCLHRELAETVLHLRRRGYAVTLILVVPGRHLGVLGGPFDLPSVPIHHVWTDYDLVRSI
jgi:uncharacterized protein (DUF58 family)